MSWLEILGPAVIAALAVTAAVWDDTKLDESIHRDESQ